MIPRTVSLKTQDTEKFIPINIEERVLIYKYNPNISVTVNSKIVTIPYSKMLFHGWFDVPFY